MDSPKAFVFTLLLALATTFLLWAATHPVEGELDG